MSEERISSTQLGRGVRRKTSTVRGQAYQLEVLKGNRKSAFNAFNRSVTNLQLAMTKSDLHDLKEKKARVKSNFALCGEAHAMFISAVGEPQEVEACNMAFDKILGVYNKIMDTVDDCVRRIELEAADEISLGESASGISRMFSSRSRTSYKSHKPSEKGLRDPAIKAELHFVKQEEKLHEDMLRQQLLYNKQQQKLEMERRAIEEQRFQLQTKLEESQIQLQQRLQELNIQRERAKEEARDVAFSAFQDHQYYNNESVSPVEYTRNSTSRYPIEREYFENPSQSQPRNRSVPFEPSSTRTRRQLISPIERSFPGVTPLNVEHKRETIPKIPQGNGHNYHQVEPQYNPVNRYVTRRVVLPSEELNVFDGSNVLEYPAWKSRFKDLIEKNVFEPSRRINYLLNYTSGEAREAIEGFVIDPTDESYLDAIATLDRWYGDRLSISQEYKSKLQNWPVILTNDCGKSFRKFSNFLNSCKRLMPDQKFSPGLDDEELNQKLAVKLPKSSRETWSRKVYVYKENRKFDIEEGLRRGVDLTTRIPSFPTFAMFVNFVQEEAYIASQPVVGTAVMDQIVTDKRKASSQSSRSKFKARSFVTSIGDEHKDKEAKSETCSKSCPICDQSHKLEQCSVFKERPYDTKVEYIKKSGSCFRCLEMGHISKNCKNPLSCSICSKKHPTILHSDQPVKIKKPSNDVSNVKKSSEPKSTNSSNVKTSCMVVAATDNVRTTRIVPVYVYQNGNSNKKCKVYCALDEQSDSCFISNGLCQKLNVEAVETMIQINCLGTRCTTNAFKVKSLIVESMDGCTLNLPPCYSREEIPIDCNQIIRKKCVELEPSYKEILSQIPEFDEDIKVELLLGTNCPRALKPIKVLSDPECDSYGIQTLLGWSIVGLPVQTDREKVLSCHRIQSKEVMASSLVPVCNTKEMLTPRTISQFSELDFLEYKQKSKTCFGYFLSASQTMSVDDKKFMQRCEQSIRLKDNGHYELALPFRDENPVIADNKNLAVQRLKGIKKRMNQDPKYKSDYFNFMNKLLQKGLAVKVDKDDVGQPGMKWYLIHHGVYHPMKPEKIRVVYDGSAKYKDVSLNQMVLPGPSLTNSLVGVLLRFRKGTYCWMADIELMFYTVHLSPYHQDFFRFLFWESEDIENDPVEYKMTVHSFGISSSPSCCVYALMKTAEDNKQEFGERVANVVLNHSYVDDILYSEDSLEVASLLAKQTKELCFKGRFKLGKYSANDPRVLKQIPENDRCSDVRNLDKDYSSPPIVRTLGVEWSLEHDAFMFRITLKDRPFTRRGILATVSSVWDPCGFLSTVMLEGKLILQSLTRDNKDWDEEVPSDIRPRWERWRNGLPKLAHLKISRCFKPKDFGKIHRIELHHFSDASEYAYGQCSYLRLVDENKRIHCSLVIAKGRIAPLKSVSIPRLELTAALVSARISVVLEDELKYENVSHTFWTDSQVVLGYISNESKRFHVYVANRVAEIREKSDPKDWYFVDSKSNVADDLSRGMSPSELTEICRFLRGPDFLWQNLELSKKCDSSTYKELEISNPEIRKTVLTTKVEEHMSMSEIISRFSRLQKALKFIMVFKKYMKYLKLKDTLSDRFERKYVVDDFLVAKRILIQIAQQDKYSEEITILDTKLNEDTTASNRNFLKKNSSLFRLCPFLDEAKLLRVGGRLAASTLSNELRHPVILPKSHHVTKLLIKEFHEKVHHQGRGITHNAIREAGYWIVGGTSSISSIISNCVICKRLRGKFVDQIMADLPADRLEAEPAFTYCGCDLFGPFIIRDGRKDVKRYGVLFTCLACRAIRIEVTPSLETDSFINSLRRFICRNGPIRLLRCDRGTNFVGASKELAKAYKLMDQSKIKNFLLQENCDYFPFKFNMGSASYQGGVWERQIHSARSVLNAILVKTGHQLDDDSLRTFMAEAESVVNCRPLTIENLASVDGPLPLTPNHILTGKTRLVLPPPGHFSRPDLYTRKRWRRVQHLANEFWQRFNKEFLQNQQSRCKWNYTRQDLKVNDIVIVVDDNLPRNAWKLGRIEKIYPDEDGHVRRVQCRIASKFLDNQGKPIKETVFLDRPIQKLILFLRSEDSGG